MPIGIDVLDALSDARPHTALRSSDRDTTRRGLHSQLLRRVVAAVASAASWALLGYLVASGRLALAATDTAAMAARTGAVTLVTLVRAGACRRAKGAPQGHTEPRT